MDVDSATNAVKEEHLPVEETDDSCIFEYFEIVPVTRDTDGSCTTECVSGDWSAEVKQETLAVVKQEPGDVRRMFVIYFIFSNFSLLCYKHLVLVLSNTSSSLNNSIIFITKLYT